ncbi:putative bifunctional diguanylate cyclase/phosphodiesterase [Zobellella endophytica]|nr:bifunctional diguanylate cyclase/phosphodiesterase [Zobellella endophytica]
MPTDAKRIAQYTYLLLTIMACTLMGALGVVASFLLSADDALSMVITPGGALGVMLAGLGLGCAIREHRHGRRLFALALLLLGLYSLWRHGSTTTPGAGLGVPYLPVVWALLLIGLCLLGGPEHRRCRLLWRAVGLLGVLAGVAVLLGQWLLDMSEVMGPHPASACIASLFMLVFGLALILAGGVQRPYRLSRPAQAVGMFGIGITCLLWYLMSFQHHLDIRRASDTMVDNAENAMTDVINTHVLLLQRLAERIALSVESDRPYPHLRDAQSYLRDVPSIDEIALVQPGRRPVWRQLRHNGESPLQLDHPALSAWLARPALQPRMVVLGGLYPVANKAQAVIALPIIQTRHAGMQLLARVDLARMMQNEIHMELLPFVLHVNVGDVELFELADRAEDHGHSLFMNRRVSLLPYGPETELISYLGDMHSLGRAALLRLLMALSGFFLSFLAAMSIELMRLGLIKSRDLEQAKRHLENQHQIEEMIIRQQPLTHILAVISRLLGEQLPHSRNVVLLARDDCLWMVGDAPLPAEPLRQLVAQLSGPLLRGREVALGPDCPASLQQAGFGGGRAYPVRAADGRVLGGLLLCHRTAFAADESARPLIDNAVGLMALALERDHDKAQLVESEQRYRSLFDHNPDMVFALDLDGYFTSINHAFCQQLELTPEEVLGQPYARLVEPDDLPGTDALFREVVTGEARRYQLTAHNTKGRKRVLDLTNLPIVVNGRIIGVYGIGKDITRQREDERRLAYNASHDALTGLPNRHLLDQRLRELGQAGGQTVVLFIDLDGFKPINDSLGHEVGDRLLVEAARRLGELARGEFMAARFGGDEFVMVLHGSEAMAMAPAMAERLLAALAQPYLVDQNELFLTASIGLALGDREEPVLTRLVQQADMAMYEAKRQGRNHYQWYNDALNILMQRRVLLRNELQDAIDHHQLELYYQPLFDRQGKVVSVEALLRWPHPHKGLISPAEFIPLAEETGQIIAISEWVLEQACRDALRLNRQGDCRVAVNLSPLQFYRSNFLHTLEATLARTGLPGTALELELTEGILMNDTQFAIELLRQIRRLGIRVAIDDFGTGFSSLSYLKHLPVDKVKIDRSFIQDLAEGSHDAAITRGIMVMAHQLALEVVAEGVETRHQFELLNGYGCDYYQGFLLARPMTLPALSSFLSENRQRLLTAVNK